ncbi:MAG: flagellar assembly protein FliW [Alphaproteobacteria bacterium]|nr:flagellar assembly protein FliW [Alphaproteobacteria bacterium]
MYATTQTDASKVMIANSTTVGLDSNEDESKSNRMTTPEGTSQKPAGPQIEKITTRFGAITVDTAKAMLFPVGLLGMPDKHHFVLTAFPNPKLGQFKLLQSLDDHELSFITLPIEVDNAIVDRVDIDNACKDMEIAPENLAIALIVSVHRGMTNVQLSVNARAPIFIDTNSQAAAQYVFTSSKYKVQHFITGEKEKDAAAE